MKKLLFLLFLSPFFLFGFYRFLLLPPKKEAEARIFVVPKGANGKDIARKLKKEGFIRNAFAFRLLLKEKGLERKIRSGDFLLSGTMSASRLPKVCFFP